MADLIGRQFGNYVLLRLLGEGSIAQVYLGEHVYLRTQAAIKVLDARLTPAQLEVFRQEAGQSARLEHPHLVRVLESGVQDQLPFLVMQYAPHGTLRQRHLPGQPLDPETILPYVRQVTAALHYLHERRLVHRGVKPENLLLGRSQEILLSDFGLLEIAWHARRPGAQERSGAEVYLAPEYVRGHAEPASDQYALGAVVYEWLAGERLPVDRNVRGKAAQDVAIPPLSSKVHTISPAMEWVVMQALVHEPQQRFASVLAFATAFEDACQTSQEPRPVVLARRLPLTDPAATPVSPPSAPGSAAALGAPTQPDPPTLPTLRAPTPSQELSRKRPFSRRSFLLTLAGVTVVGAGVTGLELITHFQAGHRTSQQPTVTPVPPGMRFLTYKGHTDFVAVLAWSPDGKNIASGGGSGEALIWNSATGRTVLSYPGYGFNGGSVNALAWSPNGSYIASGGADAVIQVWKSATGSLSATFADGEENQDTITSVAWSPNGRWIAAANGTNEVVVLDGTSFKLAFTYLQHSGEAGAVAWSPDSTLVASGCFEQTVEVWKVPGGERVIAFSEHTHPISAVAWSPDGQLVASSDVGGTVQVWEATTSKLRWSYQDPFHVAHDIAWSPNGKRIAIACEKMVVLWEPMDGKVVYTYHGHTDKVWTLAWSPDGTRIASGSSDQTVQIWGA